MSHMPRSERIAQIVATLVDAPHALTTYAIARRVKMSVSPHLYALLEQAHEMHLISREMVERPNGMQVALYASTVERVEECAKTDMFYEIYYRSKSASWFVHNDEIPF